MKILFMGTPDFAVKTLEASIAAHEVVAVFTQPDKPKGRGNKLTPPPIKVVAETHQIQVLQPDKIRKGEWPDKIRAYKPDVIVVVAYGQILSQEILDIPKYGCINVHASLLPKYRGAAPINWAIAHGETQTGVTTMMMDVGIDTGDMLLKTEVTITNDMDAQMLHDVLAQEGASLLIQTLERLEMGTIIREKQDEASSCHAPMMNKEISKIDWQMTSTEIRNRVRAFNPWPIAHTTLGENPLKVFNVTVIKRDDAFEWQQFVDPNTNVGTIVHFDKIGLYVKTGDGFIRIDTLQWGSNKRMSTQAFLLGNVVEIGTELK
jgi:methionyl-tRNA formyltransferase